MTFGTRKGGKLRNDIIHNVICVNQKTICFVFCWLCAPAMFDVTCFSPFIAVMFETKHHFRQTDKQVVYSLIVLETCIHRLCWPYGAAGQPQVHVPSHRHGDPRLQPYRWDHPVWWRLRKHKGGLLNVYLNVMPSIDCAVFPQYLQLLDYGVCLYLQSFFDFFYKIRLKISHSYFNISKIQVISVEKLFAK